MTARDLDTKDGATAGVIQGRAAGELAQNDKSSTGKPKMTFRSIGGNGIPAMVIEVDPVTMLRVGSCEQASADNATAGHVATDDEGTAVRGPESRAARD